MTGIFPGRALDINASGQVVGYSFQKVAWHSSSANQTSQYAVLWDNFQTTSLFGTPSGDRSEAHGINDHGQIVGVGGADPGAGSGKMGSSRSPATTIRARSTTPGRSSAGSQGYHPSLER